MLNNGTIIYNGGKSRRELSRSTFNFAFYSYSFILFFYFDSFSNILALNIIHYYLAECVLLGDYKCRIKSLKTQYFIASRSVVQ